MEASSAIQSNRLDEVTVCLEDVEEAQGIIAENSLAVKILSDKSFNRGATKNILCKAWGDPEGLKISDFGVNMFLFTFQSVEEANEVIKKGPWYVMGKLVSVQNWSSQTTMKDIDFSKVQCWVQLHGLPNENLNVRSAEKLLSHMGEIMEIENPLMDGLFIRHFIRARIKVNIKNPLSTGCWIPRKNMSKIWMQIKYEKLQDMCFNCGIIGHEQRNCNVDKEMIWLNGKEIPRYGQKLSVPPAKELRVIIEERERWKQRAHEQRQENNSSSRREQQGENSIQQRALVITPLGDNNVQVNQLHEEETNRDHMEEGLDGELPEGCLEESPEGSPSTTLRLLRETCDYFSPPSPFSSMRMRNDQPGFKLDIGERRFGEHPWRPFPMEASVELQSSNGEGSSGGMGQQGLIKGLQDSAVNKDSGSKSREEKIEEQVGRLMGDKVHEVTGGQCQGPTNIAPMRGSPTEFSEERGKAKAYDLTWEKERESNKTNYDQMQSDLLALRKEVAALYEDRGKSEIKNCQTGSPSHPSPTTVDLQEHLSRPGLGPNSLGLLDLEKEDIGLKNPIALLDYPCPPERHKSIQLSEQEIKKCRAICEVYFNGDKNKRQARKVTLCKMVGEDCPVDKHEYMVEFPNDELEVPNFISTKLGEDEETGLAEKVSKALILKRPREEPRLLEYVQSNEEEGKESKKVKIGEPVWEVGGRTWSIGTVKQFNYQFDRMDLEMGEAITTIESDGEDHYSLKAEEAGQTLPPKFQ